MHKTRRTRCLIYKCLQMLFLKTVRLITALCHTKLADYVRRVRVRLHRYIPMLSLSVTRLETHESGISTLEARHPKPLTTMRHVQESRLPTVTSKPLKKRTRSREATPKVQQTSCQIRLTLLTVCVCRTPTKQDAKQVRRTRRQQQQYSPHTNLGCA